jgi:hypothetical protein
LAANGYPYFFCTGHPMFDPADPAVYVNATVAIASRHPFVSARPLSGVAGVPDDTVIDADFNFSRTPVDAVIDLPGSARHASSSATSSRRAPLSMTR